jgi:hypothetical protein
MGETEEGATERGAHWYKYIEEDGFPESRVIR